MKAIKIILKTVLLISLAIHGLLSAIVPANADVMTGVSTSCFPETGKPETYGSLTIDCVDTITEMGYARMNVEFLDQMEASYEEQYAQAVREGKGQTLEVLSLYLNEIARTKVDFEDLMDNGDLKETGVLLFMVTGHYVKDNEEVPFIFFVTADKRELYTLDPFGDNLLYKDEK